MLKENFYYFIFGNFFYLYVTIFFTILSINLFIFKKNLKNILDPLIITLTASASIFTVLIFLRLENKVDLKILNQLTLISISFLISFKLFSLSKGKIIGQKKKSKHFFLVFYIIHTILYLIISLFFIKIMATGMGFHDKLNVFKGLGFFNYVAAILFPGQLILLVIKREVYNIKRKKDLLQFIYIAFLFIIKGGKTDILFLLMYIFLAQSMFKQNKTKKSILKQKRNEKLMIVIGFIIMFFVFKYVNGTKNYFVVFKKIYFRLLSEADIYYGYYPNNVYKFIPKVDLNSYYLVNLFKPIIKRIFDDVKVTGLGINISSYLYKIDNPNFGPNTRAEVIWQQNLGYFGVIFAMMTGYIFAKIRSLRSKNFIANYIIIILIVKLDLLLRDFSLFSLIIIGIILVVPSIYLLTIFLKPFIHLKKNYKT